MGTKLKRITFAITPKTEEILNEAKKMFYDSTKSEMIRLLVATGLETIKSNELKEKE